MPILIIAAIAVIIIFFGGIKIVRPTHRGLIETLGKYTGFAMPGFHWIVPVIQKLYVVNVTEQMVNAEPQVIITNDNLNATVDAQVYFKVKPDEESVKASIYNANNYYYQIVNLARTTLRNIIGTMSLKSANSERGIINTDLHHTLETETKNWGIEITRTELKEIDPPKDVQETMNKVVKAENEKIAAIDFATATETAADGQKRAEIKRAEGVKQAKILEAEGEAQAIKLVNEAAQEYFVGNAQLLRSLQTVENALKNNAKIIVPGDAQLINMIGEMSGVVPIEKKKPEKPQ
ncbi:SPFH/Band 7/PHB domain protein [Oscillospiraceae bacterium CM]|nr:SPFH/Band 7/PHB domain protein [Oscillospiraceae bacterium CM]